MTLARPAARWQRHQIDAEITKSSRFAQALPQACTTRRIEWLGIARTLPRGYGGDVNFRHALPPRSTRFIFHRKKCRNSHHLKLDQLKVRFQALLQVARIVAAIIENTDR